MVSKQAPEQLEVIKRGCHEFLVEEELGQKLAAGRPLRIKAGFDPTAPDLHLGQTEVVFNSTWMDKLDAAGLIKLAATHTVARMLERDDFGKRYQGNQPIAI